MSDEPVTQPQDLGPRYVAVRPIGQGGMGAVWLARDVWLDRLVAIKVIRHRQGEADGVVEQRRRRFHREARIVASLAHPNIVPLFDTSGPDVPSPFIVTEYIGGATLRQALDTRPLLPQPAIAVVLREVCRALAYAHGRSVVHRDLKPANVIVDVEGRVRLLDFGVAKVLASLDGRGGERLRTAQGFSPGTPAYMSPEQRLGGALDHRSDLFALGVLAYELVTGRLPFDVAAGPLAAARGSYVAPSDARPEGLEPTLATLIAGCLQPDPGTRPASAHVVAELLAPVTPRGETARSHVVAAVFGTVEEPSAPDEPGEVRTGGVGSIAVDAETAAMAPTHLVAEQPTLAAPSERTPPATTASLLGRDQDVAWFQRALHEVMHAGHGRVLVLRGEPGLGKTSLLRALRQELDADTGIVTAHGACVGRVGAPLAGILALLQDLSSETLAEVRSVSSAGAWALQRQPERGAERQGALIVRALLSLAERGPLVLFLDDLHHADESTADILVALATALAVRDVPLGVVASVDPVAAADHEPVLRCLTALAGTSVSASRTLGPLDRAAVHRIIGESVRPDERLVDHLFYLCGGNPLHLAAMIRHVQDVGVVRRTDGGAWEIAPDLASAGLPDDLRELTRLRLQLLAARSSNPDVVQRVLYRCALSGPSVPYDLLAALIGREGEPGVAAGLDSALDHLVAERVLSERVLPDRVLSDEAGESGGDADEVLEFTSGLYREAVLAAPRARGRTQRSLHRHFAELLLERHRGTPETVAAQVADHFEAAQLPGRALPWLVAAARMARRAWNLIEAEHWWTRAAAAVSRAPSVDATVDATVRADVALGLAETAVARGTAAHNELEELLGTAPAPSVRAQAHHLLATLSEREAAWEAALEHAVAGADAAREAGREPLARRCEMQRGRVLARAGRGDEAMAIYRPLLAALEAQDDPAELGYCLSLVASAELGRGEREGALSSLERALALHRRLGDRYEEARCLYNRALIAALQREADQALQMVAEAEALATELGLGWLATSCPRLRGDILVSAGRHDAAVEAYDAAIRLAEAGGHELRLALALVNQAWALLHVERLAEAAEAARRGRGFHAALAVPALQLAANVVEGEAARRGGRLDEARSLLEAALAQARDASLETDNVAEAHASLGLIGLARGESAEARRYLSRAAKLFAKLGDTERHRRLRELLAQARMA